MIANCFCDVASGHIAFFKKLQSKFHPQCPNVFPNAFAFCKLKCFLELVTIREQPIELTVKEFEIFSLLILNPKRVFTYEMLMELLWEEDYTYYSSKAVNNHVSNLRRKLKIAPNLPDYVKSVYGIGYKFEAK